MLPDLKRGASADSFGKEQEEDSDAVQGQKTPSRSAEVPLRGVLKTPFAECYAECHDV
jgi:hypothetical protein